MAEAEGRGRAGGENVGGGSANEIAHTSDVGGITRMIHLKCDAGMSHAEAMHNNLILDQSLLLLNSLCPMYCHRLTIPIQ